MNAQHITLPIYNLGCGDESRTVEHILTRLPGVTHVYVNPATEMAYVEYDPALSDSARLFAALEREGYGPPARQPVRQTSSQMARKHTLDVQRMALAGGIFLAGLYTLCILVDLLFPTVVQMERVWELALLGFDWADRGTLPLGFIEAFVYGAAGAAAFAALYNVLPARAVEPAATTCCATQPPAVGPEGRVRP